MSERSNEQHEQVEAPLAEGSEAGRATSVKPKPAASPKVDRLPPYRVLLHNDDVNEMTDVVDAICDLTPLDLHRAAKVMLEAHTRGVALLLTTHRERAELYVDQFACKKLTVTIEPEA